MTYGYLLSIPCIGAPPSAPKLPLPNHTIFIGFYALVNAKIKYDEGYIDLQALGYGVIPKPHPLWSKAHKDLILPSILAFAFGWAFEITSHLEELAFWLFLLHQVRIVMETPFSCFSGNHLPFRVQISVTGSQVGNSEVGSSVHLSPSRVFRL